VFRIVCAAVVLVASLGAPATAFAQGSPAELSGVWARIVTAEERPFYLGSFQASEPRMTAWGEAKYKETKPSFGPRGVPIEQTNDPVYKGCFPPGVPRAYLHPFPFQIVNVPGREVIILYEYDHLVRHVYTDGRPHDTSLGPTWIGSSIGKWEGDTLVVDTIGLSESTWIDRWGHPHSEELRVVERFRRVDPKTLQIDITINDPKAYVEPWTFRLRYELRPPEWRMLEVVCEDDATFIDFEKAAAASPK
jgi:hypothetical protein